MSSGSDSLVRLRGTRLVLVSVLAGAGALVLTFALPWATYGSIGVHCWDLPPWSISYLVLLALHTGTLVATRQSTSRLLRAAWVVLAVAASGAGALLARASLDPRQVFGDVAPAIYGTLSAGAIAGSVAPLLLLAIAFLVASRHGSTGQPRGRPSRTHVGQ